MPPFQPYVGDPDWPAWKEYICCKQCGPDVFADGSGVVEPRTTASHFEGVVFNIDENVVSRCPLNHGLHGSIASVNQPHSSSPVIRHTFLVRAIRKVAV